MISKKLVTHRQEVTEGRELRDDDFHNIVLFTEIIRVSDGEG
jgi:hypothetical protein